MDKVYKQLLTELDAAGVKPIECVGQEFEMCIRDRMNATPVITTATDINNKFAVDVFAKKCRLAIVNKMCIRDSCLSVCQTLLQMRCFHL